MQQHKHHTKKYKYIPFAALAILLLGVGIFSFQRDKVELPGAELRFSEVSQRDGMKGAVIPASCDSLPVPISHFGGDCTTICQTAPNPLVVANTQYNAGSNSCVCRNGKTNPPDCNLPADPQVRLSFNPADLPPVITVSANKRFISTCGVYDLCYGQANYIDWTSTNAQSCSGSWGQTSIGTGGSYYTGALNVNKTYTVTCYNGGASAASAATVSVKPYTGGGGGGGCFVEGTLVTLANGEKKDIKTITAGEYILSSYGPEEVKHTYALPYKGKLYAFNGSNNYFVTDTHPFMTTEGWKSFNPEGTRKETPDIEVGLLTVGDTLIKANGTLEKLNAVDSKDGETTVYNLGLGSNHTYFADEYLVHNKVATGGDGVN